MRRLAWSQLRFRTRRALALLAGMLVATTAFTVLTAAARTAQIRTIGTVNAHFQPAYDILVRPAGARSRLESATGTVQPDFLSGIYGGITMSQWNQISRIGGVQVAAPIAMVGYTFMNAQFPVRLPAADVAKPGRQLLPDQHLLGQRERSHPHPGARLVRLLSRRTGSTTTPTTARPARPCRVARG